MQELGITFCLANQVALDTERVVFADLDMDLFQSVLYTRWTGCNVTATTMMMMMIMLNQHTIALFLVSLSHLDVCSHIYIFFYSGKEKKEKITWAYTQLAYSIYRSKIFYRIPQCIPDRWISWAVNYYAQNLRCHMFISQPKVTGAL